MNEKRLSSEHKHYVYQQIKPNVSTKQTFVVAVDMVNEKKHPQKGLGFLALDTIFHEYDLELLLETCRNRTKR